MSREVDERAIATEQRSSEVRMIEKDWSIRMVGSFAGIARRVQAKQGSKPVRLKGKFARKAVLTAVHLAPAQTVEPSSSSRPGW
jgi:hypothetical protein